MGITLELDKMTTAEKLEVLDLLLEDLSQGNDKNVAKEPIVLSRNGQPSSVVQDAASYNELIETKERMETLRGIQKGMAEAKSGNVTPSDDFFNEFFNKYDIPINSSGSTARSGKVAMLPMRSGK